MQLDSRFEDNVKNCYYFFNYTPAMKIFSPVVNFCLTAKNVSLVNYNNFFCGKSCKICSGKLSRLCLVLQARSHYSKK